MTRAIAVWTKWPAPAEGVDLYEWQDGRCAWCGHGNGSRALNRDHCHFTGLVRGYLCSGCNSHEATSSDPAWDEWRKGDNPAFAHKFFEIYRNNLGITPVSTQGALHWYSPEELHAYFTLIVPHMESGAPWPEDAPWLDTALARKEAAWESFRNADWSILGLDTAGGAA